MIEIKLTGQEALEYLLKESSAVIKFNELQKRYDKLYEQIQTEKMSQVEEVSQRIEDQSQLLKDVRKNTKPSFASKESYKDDKKEVPGEIGKVTQGNKSYTEADIAVINAALNKKETNKDRTIQIVAAKLGRTVAALRSKLNELGMTTKNHIIYIRD